MQILSGIFKIAALNFRLLNLQAEKPVLSIVSNI